ncbi:MAG: MarR family transcriptional regulator [Georgfuchsia sp.]
MKVNLSFNIPTKKSNIVNSSELSVAEAQIVEQEVLLKFRVIFNSIKKHYRWIEEQTGVNGAQLWFLAMVVETPGIRVKDVAKMLAIHQSTASNLVDRLVSQGLIRRVRSDEDQRVVHLFPKPEGKKLIKQAPKPLRGVLLDALGGMESADLIQLNLQLTTLVSRFKVRDEKAESKLLANN